jgi:hypothetical protein
MAVLDTRISSHRITVGGHTTHYLAAGPEAGPLLSSCTAGRSSRSAGGTSCRCLPDSDSGRSRRICGGTAIPRSTRATRTMPSPGWSTTCWVCRTRSAAARRSGWATIGAAQRCGTCEPSSGTLPRGRESVRAVPHAGTRARCLDCPGEPGHLPRGPLPRRAVGVPMLLRGAVRPGDPDLRRQSLQHRQVAVSQGRSCRVRQAGRHRDDAHQRRLVRPAGRSTRRADGSGRRHRGRPADLCGGARPERFLRARRLLHEPRGQRGLCGAGGERRAPGHAGAVRRRAIRLRLRDHHVAPRRADARVLRATGRSGRLLRSL